MCVQATSSEYSEESDLESLGGPGVSIGQSHGGATGGASRLKKKRDSQASYTSDMMESESDFRELEMNMDIIDEYYYGVRIFPGQDPSQASQIPPNPAFAVTSRAARPGFFIGSKTEGPKIEAECREREQESWGGTTTPPISTK